MTQNDGFFQVQNKRRRFGGKGLNTSSIFSSFGYFFSCNEYEHKAMDCRRVLVRRNNFVNNNAFAPLFNFNIICFKCNNLGHNVRN